MLKRLSLKAYNAYAPLVRSEAVGHAMRKAFEKSNYFVYKFSGGRVWHKMGDAPIILVKTVGRKTGRTREFPLLGVRVDGRWIIIGSNAGRQTDPLWVRNIRANPDITITEKTAVSSVRAREVHDQSEYDRMFAAMATAYPNYRDYAEHTDRRMPIFVLEPSQ